MECVATARPEVRNAAQIKAEVKIPLGRPRSRWDSNVQTNLRQISVEG